jgi:hypothetical protein
MRWREGSERSGQRKREKVRLEEKRRYSTENVELSVNWKKKGEKERKDVVNKTSHPYWLQQADDRTAIMGSRDKAVVKKILRMRES